MPSRCAAFVVADEPPSPLGSTFGRRDEHELGDRRVLGVEVEPADHAEAEQRAQAHVDDPAVAGDHDGPLRVRFRDTGQRSADTRMKRRDALPAGGQLELGVRLHVAPAVLRDA